MATIEIRREHSLSEERVRAQAEELARSLESRFALKWSWVGNRLVFDAPTGVAKGTKGHVELLPNSVVVEIDLPLVLRVLKGKVESKVREKLDKLL